MQKLTKIVALACVVVLLVLSLVSCSKYPALKKAFEKEGYTPNESFDKVTDSIKEELEKDEYAVELHLLTKENGITSVLIVEFKSTKELVEAYKENDTLKGLIKDIKENEDVQEMYDAMEEAGFVKGNCLVVPLSILYVSEITNVVKSVK